MGGSGTSGGATSAAYCFISAARLGGHSGRYLLTWVGVGVGVRARGRIRVGWLADPSPSPNPNQVVTPAGTYLVTRYLLTQSALRNAPHERPISMSRSRSRSGLPASRRSTSPSEVLYHMYWLPARCVTKGLLGSSPLSRARRSSTASNGEPPLDRADSARSDCGSAPVAAAEAASSACRARVRGNVKG